MLERGKGRPNKEKVEEMTEKENTNDIDQLKLQLAELQALVKELQKEKKEKPDDSDKVSLGNYVKVMSLEPNILNLSTGGNGKGNIFTFKRFGEVKRILYDDLVKIMEAHRNFLEQGKFYIMKKEVIQAHGLDDLYEKILPKEKIEKIINGDNQTDAVNFFLSATDSQQDMICNMFIKKIYDGQEVDLNLADRLSRIMQKRVKGYDIQKEAEKALQYTSNAKK